MAVLDDGVDVDVVDAIGDDIACHSSSRAFKQHTPTGVRAHLCDVGQLSVLLAMPVGFIMYRLGVGGDI